MKKTESKVVRFVANAEDLEVLTWLRQKTGLNDSGVVKLALRELKDAKQK